MVREPCSGVRAQANASLWGDAMRDRDYGLVAWRTSDLDALVPSWSEERRRQFLDDNEEVLYHCQIDAGYQLLWELLESELAMEAAGDAD